MTNRKPHKHAELIKAWADGAEIEVSHRQSGWFDDPNPDWACPYCEIRVKSKPREWWVLCSSGDSDEYPRYAYPAGKGRQLLPAPACPSDRYIKVREVIE